MNGFLIEKGDKEKPSNPWFYRTKTLFAIQSVKLTEILSTFRFLFELNASDVSNRYEWMRIRVPICGLSQPSDYAFTLFTSYPVETGPPKLWNLTMKSWFAAAVVGAVIGQSFIQTDLALGQTQTQARPLGQNGVGQNGIGQNTVGKSATPQPKQQNRPANNIPGTVAVTSQTSFPIHFSVDKDAD
ncbi:MAG: hypothetical protein ACI9G1_005488, partial [Pirellulaceae bacterium]